MITDANIVSIKYNKPTNNNVCASELKLGNSLTSEINANIIYKHTNIIRQGITTPTTLFLKIICKTMPKISAIAM